MCNRSVAFQFNYTAIICYVKVAALTLPFFSIAELRLSSRRFLCRTVGIRIGKTKFRLLGSLGGCDGFGRGWLEAGPGGLGNGVGTVVAIGQYRYGQCDVGFWQDIQLPNLS